MESQERRRPNPACESEGQGRANGTVLMTAAEQWAVQQGAEVITLETDLNNPTSMPFYEHRMGYTPSSVKGPVTATQRSGSTGSHIRLYGLCDEYA